VQREKDDRNTKYEAKERDDEEKYATGGKYEEVSKQIEKVHPMSDQRGPNATDMADIS
jgi:hypothetical protein